MKKLFVIAILFCFISVSVFAQHDHSSHQKQTTTSATEETNKSTTSNANNQKQLSSLLSQYYSVKNALVAGDGNAASASADVFSKTLNSIDHAVVPEESMTALLKDATSISQTKDVKKQRDYFSTFSTNMAALSKTVKLTSEPIYQAYCPMKKASWLSSDKTIKNPYFGSAMLTCGKVVETINQ